MSYQHDQNVGDSAAVAEGSERRIQPRLALLLLRSAKLVGPSGEFLCIVRDVSETGVKLRMFHPILDDEDLALEFTTGIRFGLEKVWEAGGEAGFRFIDPVDVSSFVNGTGPFPKRSVRLRLNHPTALSVADRTATATILDLSREGARIEFSEHLAIAQKIRVKSDRLPAFEASVRWRRHPYYGLIFHQMMSMEELALRVYEIQSEDAAS
ncbi:PilZ domain-containing protein [Novosphingobium malaysiense]|uniref:Pilus assembly protein PilZ n=1 Tax=Novosphingobium malaysiense TaxID=1348853 RepID=A0A0B1ZPG9_9SPHN|nr:PilZ domain-containing protein [Novosphingobium malaysiense]KHK91174.1 pilus assembly protein PilZ [Novosphingobium malaysiense]